MSAFGDIVCPYCGVAYLESDPHDCHHQDMQYRIDDLLAENERLLRDWGVERKTFVGRIIDLEAENERLMTELNRFDPQTQQSVIIKLQKENKLLKADAERWRKFTRADAIKALALFDSEYIGQPAGPLWEWAKQEALRGGGE